jgi:hypothetical protein
MKEFRTTTPLDSPPIATMLYYNHVKRVACRG